MAAEGYRIRLAESGKQALHASYADTAVDLIILDPDLPDMDKRAVVQAIQNRIPPLPMVLHTFASVVSDGPPLSEMLVFVEKQANSIEPLKQVVHDLLKKPRLSKTFGPRADPPPGSGAC